ncbi:hypothetical protein, partial [Intestinimonas sp.]|uniref:hypothetical protein n=1 Tax=Intestinimonas sp. TaxID=1965293 RepID=UPI00262E3FB1
GITKGTGDKFNTQSPLTKNTSRKFTHLPLHYKKKEASVSPIAAHRYNKKDGGYGSFGLRPQDDDQEAVPSPAPSF